VLADPLILPNFHWSPVLDERRRRRLRPLPWAARCRYSRATTSPLTEPHHPPEAVRPIH
jgi:hypothetical protein